MIKPHRLLLCLCFACFLPIQVFAEAPVVDDSENFAILDEQQAAAEQPVAKAQLDDINNEEEIALAQDNRDSTTPNAALLDKIQGMQQEIQELRGQLEVQAHDLKALQQQQLSFYKDLDARLRGSGSKSGQSAQLSPEPKAATELSLGATESKSPPLSGETKGKLAPPAQQIIVAPSNPVTRGNPADEQISYLAAYDLVKNKRFDEALTAMQHFISQYPKGGYTANAQYWLGELYMVKNNYPKAIDHFEIVLKQFPSSSKAAASTLKIGYALAASGKVEEARLRLQEVLRNYPDTPTAQLATTKLESLGVS
ncbi:tol-pal system protein YbgF [Legionella jordanis]|uniref:Cell division coordinator CpoB n=1 Tax=Legionella jordanis TaxID=456 RepID=A0A0W0VBJ4_9GAMM|nr:tol-pal system protein YbgF [Legionella jordanis]KTD17482.1 outer membrane protein [Legionella jordanis]RMX05178.1 tol-pal system protein YbgF [Legionella jordanis]RMX17434.1 tol-pal system protein YbgF [Legionella jordanis]VEH13451.1 outer membrane protein [Legionella jordanis]HAT8714370.1 tol-pal system protein YbgF [Legionella jordanis]